MLEAERNRLQNAVQHLEESNVQLRAAIAQEADSELREAVGVSKLSLTAPLAQCVAGRSTMTRLHVLFSEE